MRAIAALPAVDELRDRALASLDSCGLAADALRGDQRSLTPFLGAELARVRWCTARDAAEAVARAQQAFRSWRQVPAPVRREPGHCIRPADPPRPEAALCLPERRRLDRPGLPQWAKPPGHGEVSKANENDDRHRPHRP